MYTSLCRFYPPSRRIFFLQASTDIFPLKNATLAWSACLFPESPDYRSNVQDFHRANQDLILLQPFALSPHFIRSLPSISILLYFRDLMRINHQTMTTMEHYRSSRLIEREREKNTTLKVTLKLFC